MSRTRMIVQAALVLALVWGVVWGVRAYAGSRKITTERLQERIARAGFADQSQADATLNPAEQRRREQELREIAGMVNRLDFHEREKNRRSRSAEEFFRKLSPQEKNLFIELTVMETMDRFMESLDAMPPEQRRRFVEQGLKEIQSGQTEADIARAEQLGADLLDKISREGMRAYFEKSSAQTKLDLAPLMDAMNEVMQGLRGNEFGPRSP
jgi:hypothetical protein